MKYWKALLEIPTYTHHRSSVDTVICLLRAGWVLVRMTLIFLKFQSFLILFVFFFKNSISVCISGVPLWYVKALSKLLTSFSISFHCVSAPWFQPETTKNKVGFINSLLQGHCTSWEIWGHLDKRVLGITYSVWVVQGDLGQVPWRSDLGWTGCFQEVRSIL